MRTEISCVFLLAHILKVGPTRAQDLCKTPIYTMYMYKRCVRAEEIFLYKFLEMGLNYVLLISFSFSLFLSGSSKIKKALPIIVNPSVCYEK